MHAYMALQFNLLLLQLLSGSADSTVRLWDVDDKSVGGCKALRKFSGHEGTVLVTRFLGLHTAVSGSADCTLR
jgi:WD40 repeat protein